MQNAAQRESVQLLSHEQLIHVWEAMYNGRDGEAFFTEANGVVYTFTGIVRHGQVASYQHAARTGGEPVGAAALGLWEGIKWAQASGCTWFDCNGAVLTKYGNERQRAISRFKRGFGGDLMLVHAARLPLRPLRRTTLDCVDQWGSYFKSMARRVVSRGAALASVQQTP